jgi:tetratricopeptide (TPR) repeat protein
VPVSQQLKFTNNESFRLFTAGVEALQAYERRAEDQILRRAAGTLGQCVRKYPNDVLPLFYLGVVKTLQGTGELDEALALFQKVLDKDVKELRPAAKFHLAWAHLERYRTEDFDIAERQLNEMLAENEKQTPSAEMTQLRLQAETMLAFLFVRQSLWIHRKEEQSRDSELAEAEHRISRIKTSLDKADLPEAAKADLLAEYWNVKGLVLWFRALTSPTQQIRQQLGKEAAENFQAALHLKVNWLPAMQNLARLYMEVQKRDDFAEQMVWKTLEVQPDSQYSYYLLGKIYEAKHDHVKAIEYYKRAPDNEGAQNALARLQSHTTPS